MKTNRSALWIVRIRGVMLSLALIGMVGAAFWSGESLASRFGQATACRSNSPQAPSVDISDLMQAAR